MREAPKRKLSCSGKRGTETFETLRTSTKRCNQLVPITDLVHAQSVMARRVPSTLTWVSKMAWAVWTLTSAGFGEAALSPPPWRMGH